MFRRVKSSSYKYFCTPYSLVLGEGNIVLANKNVMDTKSSSKEPNTVRLVKSSFRRVIVNVVRFAIYNQARIGRGIIKASSDAVKRIEPFDTGGKLRV